MTRARNGLRPSHFFTMAFGSSIGVSWIVLAGDWVQMAGPVGAMLCFIAGGLVIGLIALIYAEMAARYPVRGGEVAYAYAAFGTGPGFGGGTAIIVAGLLGMMTVWNAVTVGALQIFKLLGRASLLPPALAIENRHGIPIYGLVILATCCLVGALVGRSVLLPVIGVGTFTYFFAFATVALGAIYLARPEGPAPGFQVPMGKIVRPLALILSIAVMVLALAGPAFQHDGLKLPLEWLVLGGWMLAGLWLWKQGRGVRARQSDEQRGHAILGPQAQE